MQVYLVGGAVRDKLLGRTVSDMDFVVVGSTPKQMLAAGFNQVGADFPVFLHPTTQQEYALARTERKSGQGYTGFRVDAGESVTIEEDLLRRDLTINAMAIEVMGLDDNTPKTGVIVDLYGGQQDLQNKRLRHVSDAFSEDPLRVLRVARFYSRFATLGFDIDEQTFNLMKNIVNTGELTHLTKERIWQESQRATMQASPQVYWQTLYQVGALAVIMPSLANAWKNQQVQELICIALQKSAQFNLTMAQRWAILLSSLAKVSSNLDEWVSKVESLHKQHTIPKYEQKLAKLYAQLNDKLSTINKLSAVELMALVQDSSAHKQPEIIEQLISVTAVMEAASKQQRINQAVVCHHAVGMADIDTGLQGQEIGNALMQARVDKLARSLK